MRAVGYQASLPISDPASAAGHRAAPARAPPATTCWSRSRRSRSIRSTPRSASGRQPEAGQWKVLGWDAVGIGRGDRARGEPVPAGRPGVLRRGDRPAGTNAEFHLVDERIVGHKPRLAVDFAEAAALPLTAITAWETLFDRLDVSKPVPGAANAILIVGGAGGVGSIAIQLARQLTDLTVIATASRPETAAWMPRARRAPCRRSQPAARRRGRASSGIGAAGVRVLDHQHRRASGRDRQADRPAGPLRADRRPGRRST